MYGVLAFAVAVGSVLVVAGLALRGNRGEMTDAEVKRRLEMYRGR